MDTDYPVHWLIEIIEKIERRNPEAITLATGKTPSGHIHIGILREIIICDSLRRVFEMKGNDINFYLFLDSLDAAKRFPDYIDKSFQNKHLGKPFCSIPCPFENCDCESYAHHFGNELTSSFEDFGIKNKVIWTHELYQSKEMRDNIEIALNNTDRIKDILQKYILPTLDDEKKENFLETQKKWMPVMAVCENCNKIQKRAPDGSIIPNRIKNYDKGNKTVSYTCPVCGYEKIVSIYEGTLKLNWRIDWPAKWALFKTTCEPAGKDHCVKGGSYDTGLEICREIYGYQGPIKVPYEWLRLGERDMKTSKGIVFTPQQYLKIADPEIFRMLIMRTNPMKHISFRVEELPQYHDYFERMENIYYSLEETESEEEKRFFEFMYPLIKINHVQNRKPKRLSFNLLIFLSQIQNILSTDKLYEKAKQVMSDKNFEIMIPKDKFKIQLNRTKNWIDEIKKILEQEQDPKTKRNLLQKISIFSIPEEINGDLKETLSETQKKGIRSLREFILQKNDIDADEIQNKIFTIAKEELEISPKKLFQAIYKLILGKKYGPRLGPFLELLDKEWLTKRLNI
ncbi:MAG: lysine--tRNA ligase [Candidatus Lokiarchaeota archaeon]|nr:lysine--tRNA ligase [Candidatus Lokiarchaeota archaeon]